MRRERRGGCQAQARGAACPSHLRNNENDDGENCRWDVQAQERSICSWEETRGMSMRRRAIRIQGEEVETRLSDMSGR